LVVEPGDIVFNKLRTWQGGLGASKYLGLVSPAYFVCRPKPNFDSTFLQYLLLSSTYLQELTRISKWQPPSQFDIGWEQLKLLPIVAPDLVQQKAIADYLDRETIRIDALIEKKKRMIELTELRRRQYWVETLDRLVQLTSRKIPLKYCAVEVKAPNKNGKETNRLSLSDGRVVAKDIESQDGLLPESFETYNIVRSGDVVLRLTDLQNDQRSLRVGHVQEAGIITSAYVALRSTRSIDPSFLTLVLRGMDARKDFYALGAGVRQSLKFDELGRLQIPVLSLDVQQETVLAASRIDDFSLALSGLLKDQIILLNEERHALITAAVTGELKIPEVAA
jgi:type I restriction enzyme S subunit